MANFFGTARRTYESKMVRFGLVGGSGVAVNTAGLFVLHQAVHLPLVLASSLSVELAIINNFVLNDRWAFRSRHPSLVRFFKFNLAALGTMAVTVTTVWVLAQQVGIDYIIANLFGIGSSAVINFVVSATWIWGQKRI